MSAPWSPDRRDIIWIALNPQAASEMKDLHPMLVLSPKSFNERTGIVIGLPMTTSKSNDSNPFAVRCPAPGGIVSYVLCHQPKSLDWRGRAAKLHPWKQVPENVLGEACRILNQIAALDA